MAKTINFCGDSFCASAESDSWTTQLAKQLNYSMIGLGVKGVSHETAIRSFNSKSDITVFCWTSADRLYYKNYPINSETVKEHIDSSPIYQAAYQFYQHLLDRGYEKQRQMRELYWFDHEVLNQYQGTAIHLWNFHKTYDFTNGIVVPGLLMNLCVRNPDERQINHLSVKHNSLLANKLYKIIRNQNG